MRPSSEVFEVFPGAMRVLSWKEDPVTEDEFVHMATQYRPRLLHVARKAIGKYRLSYGDAEEYVQGALARVWENQPPYLTRAYLEGAVQNEIHEAYRSRKRSLRDMPVEPADDNFPARLDALIMALPMRDQPYAEALVMGYNQAEIADHLGRSYEWSRSGAGTREIAEGLRRARKGLQKAWDLDVHRQVSHMRRDNRVRLPGDGEVAQPAPCVISDAQGRIREIMDPLTRERVSVEEKEAA